MKDFYYDVFYNSFFAGGECKLRHRRVFWKFSNKFGKFYGSFRDFMLVRKKVYKNVMVVTVEWTPNMFETLQSKFVALITFFCFSDGKTKLQHFTRTIFPSAMTSLIPPPPYSPRIYLNISSAHREIDMKKLIFSLTNEYHIDWF